MKYRDLSEILNKNFEDCTDVEQEMMAMAWDEGISEADARRLKEAIAQESCVFDDPIAEATVLTAYRKKHTHSASVLGAIALIPGWAGKIAVAATIALGFLLIKPSNMRTHNDALADTSLAVLQPTDTTARDSILH